MQVFGRISYTPIPRIAKNFFYENEKGKKDGYPKENENKICNS